jgi:hypothetical protein
MAKKSDDEPEMIPLERQSGANLTAIKRDLKKAKDEYLSNKRTITELNAENNAIRKRVIASGIPAKAFTHAINRAEMEADKREEYDHGYEIANEAFGHPIDLFTPLDEVQDANPKAAPRQTSAAKPKKPAANAKQKAAKSRSLAGLDKVVEAAEETSAARAGSPPNLTLVG